MSRRTACLIARGDDPYRNQAIEKHLMDTLPEGTAILFLYRNRRTLSLGRKQNAWYETPVDRFTLSGGLVLRRLSGGNAHYQDDGTVGASFLLPKSSLDIAQQLRLIGMAVGALGIQAEPCGRCDLGSGGSRFCSNAFYKQGAAAIHQSTLWVNTALGALRTDTAVEAGKRPPGLGASPIPPINLCDLVPALTPETVQEALFFAFAHAFQCEPVMLDERMFDSRSISHMAERFSHRDWLFPPAAPYTFSVAERFPWGDVAVQLLAEGGIIRQARIYTSAMEAALFDQMEAALVGAPYLISSIAGRFEQKLAGLQSPQLMQIAGDVCTLICGRIRAMDRSGEGASSLQS